MLKKRVIGPALLVFATFASAPAMVADDATIPQVYQAAENGRYGDAQAMMDKVLHDHPNSARAHWVEAELLGKQDRFREAQVELNTAERLQPSLKFANDPQRVKELQSRISSGLHAVAAAQRPQTTYTQPTVVYERPAPVVVRNVSSGHSGFLGIIVIIGLIALFFFIVRLFSGRNTVVVNGNPGYGVNMGPSYGPGYGPGVVVGQGGIGSGILGGLATGAAVGAGIVAGEELMHHMTDRDRTEVVYDNPNNNNGGNWNQPDDMGGNDFGVSDSSSWDDGGGDSGGGGSDDWN